jgi:hypothetical protein
MTPWVFASSGDQVHRERTAALALTVLAVADGRGDQVAAQLVADRTTQTMTCSHAAHSSHAHDIADEAEAAAAETRGRRADALGDDVARV